MNLLISPYSHRHNHIHSLLLNHHNPHYNHNSYQNNLDIHHYNLLFHQNQYQYQQYHNHIFLVQFCLDLHHSYLYNLQNHQKDNLDTWAREGNWMDFFRSTLQINTWTYLIIFKKWWFWINVKSSECCLIIKFLNWKVNLFKTNESMAMNKSN